MPRKGLRPRDRRGLPPADYKYNSVLVSRLVNKLNYQGRKLADENIVYDAMEILAEKTKQDALNILTQAIENIRPLLEIKARRVGGATYQVPIEVQPSSQPSPPRRRRTAALAVRQPDEL